ncbi:death-associated inhibitor of apoptosis 1-like isoform X2 [Mytilus californianus]|uniref:death-associated inhibitor of apoptosis 1-like isoform X2 n=1 Tax=Mytilus californianus TaxID=6549 RepID=UPI0022466E18|nr:death-associated inhibitor of apoptosis 1-like isoform X2 [Mytilus californianus]
MLVNIQIKPTFGIYFRRYNSMNFEQRMTFELARLETYKSAPTSLRAWRIKLAKEGLYYINDDHKCKCAFCEFLYQLSWTNGDNPDDIHRRSEAHCPFLLDRVNTNNIPMHADERTLFRSPAFLTSSSGNHQHPAVFAHGYVAICQTDRRHYVEELMEGPNSLMRQIIQYMPQREDESNTNVCISSSERVDEEQSAGQSGDARSNSQVVEQSDEPKHPKYASRSARHHSFENWPKHRTHSPTDMASAGFFYAGRKDICWCFFCGGGLENWEPNDKPWTEHARWYQNCAFVRQCKGEEFIIEQRHRNLPNAIINNRHQGLTEDSRNSVIKDCELNRLPAVRAVTEMGYDLCLVKKTYNDLQKGATTDINAAVLLEAIFQIQDQESEL